MAQVADTPANPFTKDPAAPAQGKALFDSTCTACHGPGGTGGRGPALDTGNFSHGNADYDLFQVIHGGVAGTQMPSFAGISSDNVWKLVTYIKSLGGPADTGEKVASGDAALGQAVFFGKGGCASCHEVSGRGQDLASDLSAEGTKSVAAIRDGVLHSPPANRGRVAPPHFADVTLKDGRKLTGLVRAEDSFTLHLEERDGTYLMLDKKTIRGMASAGDETPADIAQRLSPAEIENLVAYLAARKARDLSQAMTVNPKPVLTTARMEQGAAEPQNWTSYWGGYDGHHFSTLKQITPANVGRLQARWSAPLLGETVLESTPLVVDGVMYVAGPPGDVYAFDARSGVQIWKFHRGQDVKNPYEINPYNKGVAVLDGRVFFGTLDNNLIALDAHTGRELWETRVAETMEGYTLTGAPLAVKDKIVMGMSGGEMGTRGFIDAYDPATGKRLWRFYTIPKPGEPGGDTWPAGLAEYGGGATWLTGSYDPGLDTLYWPVGNPGPDYNPSTRKGDNLYSDSVLALDPDTGKLKWYYQFTPNDGHDWDSTEDMVLADQVIDGHPRKLLLHADRDGMFFVLDRSTGKFLWTKPFVRVTWNKGYDANGRPIIDPDSLVTPAGRPVFPSAGTNFEAPSYDPASGTYYLSFSDTQGFTASAPVTYEKGKQYLGRATVISPPAPPPRQGVAAIDSKTGKVLWRYFDDAQRRLAGGLGDQRRHAVCRHGGRRVDRHRDEDRQAAMAFPHRPADHGLAHGLCGGWKGIYRRQRGQSGAKLRAARTLKNNGGKNVPYSAYQPDSGIGAGPVGASLGVGGGSQDQSRRAFPRSENHLGRCRGRLRGPVPHPRRQVDADRHRLDPRRRQPRAHQGRPAPENTPPAPTASPRRRPSLASPKSIIC